LAFGNEKPIDKIEKSRRKRWRFFKWIFKKNTTWSFTFL